MEMEREGNKGQPGHPSYEGRGEDLPPLELRHNFAGSDRYRQCHRPEPRLSPVQDGRGVAGLVRVLHSLGSIQIQHPGHEG